MGMVETATSEQPADDRLREKWRQVFSMKRSAQQFRARLMKTLPAIQQEVGTDPQFGEFVSMMAATVRVLDWTIRDLDRLRIPDELFEVVPVQPTVRVGGSQALS